MLPELTPDELAAALDAVAAEILHQAGWPAPPVDALQIAGRLAVEVAYDDSQAGRGRIVRLASNVAGRPRDSILLRRDPRPERRQWAVAHEIGEKFAHSVFARLGVDPREAPGERESVANHLAGRILLPRDRFIVDARSSGWDLLLLKQRYATASHELIARRMLDFEPWIAITLFDNGRLTWRRSNRGRRRPALTPAERDCRQSVIDSQLPAVVEGNAEIVQGWPVYEVGWKREILRCENRACWDDPA